LDRRDSARVVPAYEMPFEERSGREEEVEGVTRELGLWLAELS
jgi:hypothetical protein